MEPLLAKLRNLMTHSGMGSKLIASAMLRQGSISLNGKVAVPGALVEAGDEVSIEGHRYKIVQVEDRPRLMIVPEEPAPTAVIPGKTRVHAGYHKCLTMYFRRVMDATVKSRLTRDLSFRHFFHRLDEFYRHAGNYSITSISGHCLDLDRFEDVRVSRFVRDPRDMVVSSYFYHKRGAERWCNYVDPRPEEWSIINGEIPRNFPPGHSLAEYLNKATIEEGLDAEIDLRRRHFESMLEWPDEDPRVRVYRYEDIVGREVQAFRSLFEFYEMPYLTRRVGQYHAGRFSASKRAGSDAHIRDAASGQWRQYFTPELTERFSAEFGAVLDKLGYPRT